jgi:hypothetical protein
MGSTYNDATALPSSLLLQAGAANLTDLPSSNLFVESDVQALNTLYQATTWQSAHPQMHLQPTTSAVAHLALPHDGLCPLREAHTLWSDQPPPHLTLTTHAVFVSLYVMI